MAKSIEDARIVLKRSTVALAVPTVAPDNDHTSGTWSVNDIYKGEIYINTVDGKIYTRTDAGIIQIGTFVTNGTDIVMSSGDNITSADGTTTLAVMNSSMISTVTDGTNTSIVEVNESNMELSNTDGVTTGRLQVLPVGVRINNDYVLPTVDGSNGQIIQTDGFGALSFVTPASGISGLTTNELVYGNTATSIASLPVATYPSLTEISYVKGVTSAIQTQFAAKAPLASPTFTTQITTPIVYGSSIASGTLTLTSTTNATKGKILFGTSAYDEVNNRLYLGATTGTYQLESTTTASDYIAKYASGAGNFAGWLAQNTTTTNYAAFVAFGSTYGGTSSAISRNSLVELSIGNNSAFLFRGIANVPCYFATNDIVRVAIAAAGGTFFGGSTAATARVHLAACTTAASTAQLKMAAGTVMTTAEAGAMEYNNVFYLTNSDATRRHIALAPNTTKVTAGAPYTNDGYVVLSIGGTDFKVMTTA